MKRQTTHPGRGGHFTRLAAIPLALAFVLLSLVLATPASAQDGTPPTNEYCLSCHNNSDLSLTLPSGEQVSLYVPQDSLTHSVHAPIDITCQQCHTDIQTFPHPPIQAQNARELTQEMYQACQGCHDDKYTLTQDSYHAQAAASGNPEAPVCTDCHGAHEIKPPSTPRALISQTCGQCHTDIYNTYKNSIHGKALIEEGNPDVPVCTDCHGVHNIQDPRTQEFRVREPELCAKCHADPELMGKYGISADVYSIYSTSWHGVEVSVFETKWPALQRHSAICTDCHGTHDILPTENPSSRVNAMNLLATCQQCHPGAGPDWTGAWTGHHEVSLERTPFVFYTQAFYNYLTPFVLWASALYVLLQFIRATVARVRRTL